MSAGGDEVNYSDVKFVDDETNLQDQYPSNYCLMNIPRDLQEAMQDDSMAQELDLISPGPENFVSDHVDEVEYKIDEFAGFEKRIKKSEEDLKILEEDSKDSFFCNFLCCLLLSAPRKGEF